MTASVVPVSAEIQINSFEGGHQFWPEATELSDGSIIATWQSYDSNGVSYEIFGQRFDQNGVPLGGLFQLNAPTANTDEWNLSLSALDSGGFVAAWTDNDGETGANPETSVFFQHFNASGIAANNMLELPLIGSVRHLSFDGEGNSFALSFENGDLFGEYFNSAGGRIGSEILVASGVSHGWNDGPINMPGGATYLSQSSQTAVFWSETRSVGFGQSSNAWVLQLIGPNGLNGSEISFTSGHDWVHPRLISVSELDNGDFVVAWSQVNGEDSTYTEILAARYGSDGNQVGGQISVSDDNVHDVETVALTGGGFAVVWGGSRGQAFDANGDALGQEFSIEYDRAADLVGLEPLSGGRFAALYHSTDSDGYGVFTRIFAVNSPATGNPVIQGATTEDEVLSVDISSIQDANGFDVDDLEFQWVRDGQDISGATGSSYQLTQQDVESEISVRASFVDSNGAAEELLSSTTPPVANINDLPSGAVQISGTPRLHGLLTADTSRISDEDGLGTFSYQWFRNGAEVHGAIGEDYRVSGVDIGENLTVVVSYIDGFGASETISSSPVSPAPQSAGFAVSVNDSVMDETGDEAEFEVGLNARPTANVVLRFSVSDSSEAQLLITEIVFTPDDWDTIQRVHVRGLDDLVDDGDVTVFVSGQLETTDPDYSALSFPRVTLTNHDDGLDADIEEYGDNRANTLNGMNGADRLYGEGGRDTLNGNYGNDRLYGGYGDDVLSGGEGDDLLDGEQDDDTLLGGAGNDELFGGGAGDLLRGGDGNDVLDGQTGTDTMIGGAGDDTYYVDRASDIIRDEGLPSDRDSVIVIGNFDYELGNGLENAALTEESGNAGLEGNSLNNQLDGNTSDNTLIGGGGSDSIYASGGDDTVNAGNGNDLIVGGSGEGDDVYRGGRGTDTIRYTSAEAGILVDLKSGSASSRDAGDSARIGVDQLSQIENVIGGRYADQLIGSNRANELTGRSGNDHISGGRGNDRLEGEAGADILRGGAGRDNLQGGAGRDRLDGGAGNDRLIGGGGNDTFVFSSGNDTIADFNTTNNREDIDLRRVDSISGFRDLIANHAVQEDGNVVISDSQGNSLTLLGVELTDLDRGDFLF